jgi:hypothetical protein
LNQILISTTNSQIQSDTDLRVFWLPGADNIVADALSHFKNELLARICPDITIKPLTPPRDALGVVKK